MNTATREAFRSSRLKVARAQRHLADLSDLIEDFKSDGAASWQPAEFSDPHGTTYAAHSISFKPYPEMLSPIVGDVVHNLRASLDLMASELVRNAGGDDLHVHFPIAASERKLSHLIRSQHFDDAGPAAVALLQQFKPYVGGSKELSALHALDLMDKHRSLVAPRFSIAGPTIQLWEDDGTMNPRIISDPNAPLETKFYLPPEIGFGDRELLGALADMMAVVESVLEAFRLITQ